MTIKVFNKTQLVELPTDDTYVPLIMDDSAFDDAGLYILSVGGTYGPTYQVTSSMDATVWLSTFKQRPMSMTMSGILVPSVCDAGSVNSRRAAFINLYKKYKITTATRPLRISFHGIVVTGYFDKISFGSQSNVPKALSFDIVFFGTPTSFMNASELSPIKPPAGGSTSSAADLIASEMVRIRAETNNGIQPFFTGE